MINEQDLCTGDGLCVEICPPLFFMHDDGLAYVKQADDPTGLALGQPKLQMAEGLATVTEQLFDSCLDAAEECPGECIFIEP